ncbi:MAG: hypothetical protein ABSD96_23000 [Candidatus Korobacteraceae bacterium]
MGDPGRRARAERELATQIGLSWDGPSHATTIRGLRSYLEDVEYEYQQAYLCQRIQGVKSLPIAVGIPFGADLFTPFKRAITLTSRVLDFPEECSWLVCLDEAEFLTVTHHRILNSYLRSYAGQINFKITTMPYAHYTLATNTPVPLDVGHDFEYVYIDQDPVLQETLSDEEDQQFANTIFNKRARASGSKYRQLVLKELLGPSILLDRQVNAPDDVERFLNLLRTHANAETILRAERLKMDPGAFRDQVGRKLQGALLLRDAVHRQRGREELSVYSGASMAIRCGDGNPRRLIRIFNSFLLKVQWSHRGGKRRHLLLTPKEQTRTLTSLSTSTLTRIQSEPNVGPKLYHLLKSIGDFMQFQLLERPLGTDQVSSIELDTHIGDEDWELVQRSVGLGLLYPNVNANNPDEMPEREGTFRLAYILAPYFRILPRRGKSRRLSSVFKFEASERQHYVDEAEQARLFPSTEGGPE